MSREEAMNSGAMAIFEEKYGETVRVVRVGGGISMELCGGTHTGRTGDVGLFKIVSEGAVGANLRRIEALTGERAVEYVQSQEDELMSVASLLKTTPDQTKEKVERLLNEQRDKEREMEALKLKLFSTRSGDLFEGVRELNGVKVFTREMDAASPRDLRGYADQIKDKLGSAIVVLGAKQGGKAMLICVVTKDLTGRFKAGEIISRLSTIVGGKGGGRPDMAQGGGSRPEKLESAFEAVYEMVDEGERP
jgi:alanyl-tRNA synthetase